MIPAGMAGLGRRLGSQHRQLACNLTSVPNLPLVPRGRALQEFCVDPVSEEVCDTLPRRADAIHMSTGSTHPISRRALPTLPWPALNNGRRTYTSVTGASTLVPQLKMKMCTSSGDPSDTNAGDDSGNDIVNRLKFLGVDPHNIGYGNTKELCCQIADQTDGMRERVLKFKDIYNKEVRPLLVSRCLIVPGSMDDPSTAFLHSQTFRIVNHNGSFISCFDIMVYKSGCKTAEEWDDFIDHLVQKKIYVIEDWNESLSTIEVLMYDHGLKQPDDGTDEPFYKGECDASYDPVTGTASLAYIIWKDYKIVYSEVFKSVPCSSSVEGEIHAAMALFYKCEELNIRKLQVWSDSRTVTSILTGVLPIEMGHAHRDFYLMLRLMRSRFKSLVVTWKPRELMVFADFLARAAKLEDNNPYSTLKLSLAKFCSHLQGSPVLRMERTPSAAKAVKKFNGVEFDKSFIKTGNSRYIIEVEEESKFECLVGLNQSLEPHMLELFIGNRGKQNLESLKKQLETISENLVMVENPIGESPGGASCTLTHKEAGPCSKNLVVLYDYSVAEDVVNAHDEFQVMLVTPRERQHMKEKIEELTALDFVYFNGVRLPLNLKKK